MNLTFISVVVALTGLFGLAFSLFGVLTHKRGGGKLGKRNPISSVGDLPLLRGTSIAVLHPGVIRPSQGRTHTAIVLH